MSSFFKKYDKPLFIALFLVCLLPQVTPAIALFIGLAFALTLGQPYPKFSKKHLNIYYSFRLLG